MNKKITTTAADRVYGLIKQLILSGKYTPGTYIREATLGKDFGLSRTPIREALRRLISEGWAEAIPHQGARVVEWGEQDVEEVFELRMLLEPHVVRRAALRVGAEQLAELDSLAQRMEALAANPDDSAREQISELNLHFHNCLAITANSPRLRKLLDSIVQIPVARRSYQEYTGEELQRSMRHHRELIDALAAGDGNWASSVMSAHILSARATQLRSTVAQQPKLAL